jgi:Tn3 transposase DDE domain
MNIMRTLQVEERPSRLALAIAEVGRIDKTRYTEQLNLTEGRHSLARNVFHGKRVAFNFKWRRIAELFGFWLTFGEGAAPGVNLCR